MRKIKSKKYVLSDSLKATVRLELRSASTFKTGVLNLGYTPAKD